MTLAWGFSWPVTIVGLRYCDPMLLASLRCVLGGMLITLWVLRKPDRERYHGKDLRTALVVGSFWVGIPTALSVWALQHIGGGLGAILQSTVPFFIAFFAHVYLGQNQLNAGKIGGMVLGFIGIIVLFSDDPLEAGNSWALAGGLAVILSAVSIGFAQSYSLRHFKGEDNTSFNLYLQLFGGLVILPFAFLSGLPRFEATAELIGVLFFLSLIATAIPFTLYFELFRRVDFVVLSMMAYVIPVVAVVAGIVWLGERMSFIDIIGSMLVIIGVLLATQFELLRTKLFPRSIS